jgi:hypothetical protein
MHVEKVSCPVLLRKDEGVSKTVILTPRPNLIEEFDSI